MATIIEVKDLTKTFVKQTFWGKVKKRFTAVKDISFTIQKGEFVGFLGPNGAGKTTTLKMLSGILYPTSGETKVLGYTPWERKIAFKKRISMVMGQKSQLWWELPPLDTFELYKTIYQISDKHYQQHLNKLIELLEVQDCLNTPVRQLSLGQRMKCELIAALLYEPEVLFLDEPTIGLDYQSQKKMRAFLKQYNQETQATILLTSHYMDDIKELCPRIIVINHGHIIYDGTFAELEKKIHQEREIHIDFEQENKKADWHQYGKVLNQTPLHIELVVPQTKVAHTIGEITQHYSCTDIKIIDKEAGEIITQLLA
ncbi:MAG: ATP-binding cassette domain-containing protein [Candidatus Abawacabacteria bacterium]|nr:ATP-binding cassette domain-containing protein [Candidatus Abawacabacteria bacterium]